MADHTWLELAPFFERIEDGPENLFADQPISGKHRPILDVIERTVSRIRELQHDGGAADNVASIRQRDSEVFKSAVVAKLDPPRRLHESCFGRSLDELIPGL